MRVPAPRGGQAWDPSLKEPQETPSFLPARLLETGSFLLQFTGPLQPQRRLGSAYSCSPFIKPGTWTLIRALICCWASFSYKYFSGHGNHFYLSVSPTSN